MPSEPSAAVAAWPRCVLAVLARAELSALAPRGALGWNLKPMRGRLQPQQRYSVGLHRHEQMELCLTVQGRGVMELEDRRYRMIEPALVVLNPGLFHSEAFDGQRHPYATIWITTTPQGVRAFANAYEPGAGWSCPWSETLPARHQPRLARWFNRELDRSSFEALRAALLAAVGELAHQTQVRMQQEQGTAAAGHLRVLRSVRHYLDRHYGEPLSAEQIARMTCYSPHYLNGLFAQWTGQGIRTYLIDRRMQQALRLCQETELPVQDIAARVGYTDPLYFSRAFRRYHGCAPSQARAQ